MQCLGIKHHIPLQGSSVSQASPERVQGFAERNLAQQESGLQLKAPGGAGSSCTRSGVRVVPQSVPIPQPSCGKLSQ